MASSQAGVYYDHPGWYRLVCKYDPWMQDELKVTVGFGNYKYDPKLKLWYIREPFRRAAIQVLKRHGYSVEFESNQRQKQQEQKKESKSNGQVSGPRNVPINPWSVIFERLPTLELRQKLYRQTVMVLHPDRGGHEEAMKELNEAWSKLTP